MKILKKAKVKPIIKKKKQSLLLASDPRKTDDNVFTFGSDREVLNFDRYRALRKEIPCIDAAINKIIRLTGGFEVKAGDANSQNYIDKFIKEVPVGVSGRGLDNFCDIYLDSLLTFGNALGEIILDENGFGIAGLLNIDPKVVKLGVGKTPIDRRFFVKNGFKWQEIKNSENILYSGIDIKAGKNYGTSILSGLDYFADILLKIYSCMGKNAERAGNVRYAVTYDPGDSPEDRAFAAERIKKIAEEWKKGMDLSSRGEVRDFVAAGDVDIKVIGNDNVIPDMDKPIRHILEQIISKLGIPPFLLGFSWSTTERMSQQQCDILTSELEYYRRALTPVIEKICTAYLRSVGSFSDVEVTWENINLQDEEKLANSRYLNAKAQELENKFL